MRVKYASVYAEFERDVQAIVEEIDVPIDENGVPIREGEI